MLEQLSIFAENKKGTLQDITRILQNEDINILGSVTYDSAEYGIIRMVVNQPERAQKALSDGGYFCKLTDVLGIEVQDEVGSLNRVLNALLESNINADYQYLSFNRESGKPILILHTQDIFEVEECLRLKGFASI